MRVGVHELALSGRLGVQAIVHEAGRQEDHPKRAREDGETQALSITTQHITHAKTSN
jgi:hypothetical protein